MPRLAPFLIRHAYKIDPLLPRLLPICRDLRASINELRWLREHAISITAASPAAAKPPPSWPHVLNKLVGERATGRPLQYILGSQPFSDLDILCKEGVLIPRPETEALTSQLANILLSTQQTLVRSSNASSSPPPPLRILDLCTGTGCIAMLLHHLLSQRFTNLQIRGIDIDPRAIALARQNIAHNNTAFRNLDTTADSSSARQIQFLQDDIFHPLHRHDSSNADWSRKKYDILISNPPYISPREYIRTTAKSVRDWEPRVALEPRHQLAHFNDDDNDDNTDAKVGDAFYPRLIQIANQTRASIVLLEVADMLQARRVAAMLMRTGRWEGLQIWRDWMGHRAEDEETVEVYEGRMIGVVGQGNGRAVLAWRWAGGDLLGQRCK